MEIIKITQGNFDSEVKASEKPVLVDFGRRGAARV